MSCYWIEAVSLMKFVSEGLNFGTEEKVDFEEVKEEKTKKNSSFFFFYPNTYSSKQFQF